MYPSNFQFVNIIFQSYKKDLRFLFFVCLFVFCFVFSCPAKTCHSPFAPSLSRLSEALGTAVISTPLSSLKEHKYEESAHARGGDSSVPLWAQDLLTECVPLLICPAHSLQFAAYHLLLR